jgi:hypothetical protein
MLLFAGISAAAIVGIAQPANAQSFTLSGSIFNNELYEQTSNTAPSSPTEYFFGIGAEGSNGGSYDSASATYPGPGSPQTLPASGANNFAFNSPFFSSPSDLRAAYPFGTYTVTASGSSPAATSVLNYTADYFTATVPYLTNFDSLNGFDPSKDLTLNFPSFTPNVNATEGFTFFTVYNLSGDSVFSQDFLNPSSTSVVIPGATLTASTQYTFELDFSDRLDGTDSTNNQFTEQGFDLRDDGSFTTGAVTVPAPSAGWPALLGFGLLAFCRYCPRMACKKGA